LISPHQHLERYATSDPQRLGSVLFKTRILENVRLEESPAYKETIFTFALARKSAGRRRRNIESLHWMVIQRVQENRLARHAEDAA